MLRKGVKTLSADRVKTAVNQVLMCMFQMCIYYVFCSKQWYNTPIYDTNLYEVLRNKLIAPVFRGGVLFLRRATTMYSPQVPCVSYETHMICIVQAIR